MKRKTEIQYIRLYTEGSAARSVEYTIPAKKNKSRLPRVHREKKMVILLDPVAWCGIVLAAVMLISMVIGFAGLTTAGREIQQLDGYISQLQQENRTLYNEYESGYNLDEIEHMALSIGMIPKDQAKVVPVPIKPYSVEQEPSVWDYFCTFLSGLFA